MKLELKQFTRYAQVKDKAVKLELKQFTRYAQSIELQQHMIPKQHMWWLLSMGCMLLTGSCGGYPTEAEEFNRQEWLKAVSSPQKSTPMRKDERVLKSASKTKQNKTADIVSTKQTKPEKDTTVAVQIAKDEAAEQVVQGELDTDDGEQTLENQIAQMVAYANSSLNWWQQLRDDNFSLLIQLALDANLELEASAWRLESAKAQLKTTRSQLFPNINATANLGKEQVPSEKSPNYGKSRNYSVGMDVSYEIDIWGRNFKELSAAKYGYLSAAYTQAVMERTLISNIANSYLDILFYREMENIANELKEISNDLVVISENKFKLGANTRTEVLEAKSNLEQAKKSLSNYELNRTLEITNLKLLLGLSTNQTLPVEINNRLGKLYIPKNETTVISTALARRPDVKVAQADLEQAMAKVGIAKRNFLPKFTISAGATYRDNDTKKLISAENLLYNLAAGLTAPLFQGGKLVAGYQEAKANYEAAISTYKQVVLTAIKDVQDSLKEVEIYRQQFENVYKDYRNNERIYELAVNKYEAGSTEYSELLAAKQKLLNSKMALWQGKQTLIKASIKLHKANGEI